MTTHGDTRYLDNAHLTTTYEDGRLAVGTYKRGMTRGAWYSVEGEGGKVFRHPLPHAGVGQAITGLYAYYESGFPAELSRIAAAHEEWRRAEAQRLVEQEGDKADRLRAEGRKSVLVFVDGEPMEVAL